MLIQIFFVAVLFSLSSLFCKLFSLKYGENNNSASVYTIFTAIIIILMTFLLSGFTFNPTFLTFIIALVCAVFFFLFNISFIKAAQIGNFSFLIIAQMFGGMIIPILLSTFIFEEALTFFHILGIIGMLISFVVINLKSITLKKVKISYYIWCLIHFISNGIFSLMVKVQQTVMAGAERSELIILINFYCIIIAFLFLLFNNKKKIMTVFKMNMAAFTFVFLSGVIITAAQNYNYYLISIIPAAEIFAPLQGGLLILSTLFSLFIFKEKIDLYKIIGVLISFVSILFFI
ncbi:MAG: hypothetical protein K0S55_1560 [Clostridia bacterium]|nr:hypothetical protein [Clostridia bacterium]